jgi:DNA-directed RNA polymerase specialized sigma24 family protein
MADDPKQLTNQLLAELGWVRRLAVRLAGPDDGDDLSQEVAIAALASLRQDPRWKSLIGRLAKMRR